jgi:pyrroloquinoline quinone (PQQ) biosynthesis protein C
MSFLGELRREIEAHPATNHVFLNRLATSPFAREDYRVFGENHYPLVCVFTSYLERLLCRAPSSETKTWLAKVLVDEYGEGSNGEDHAALYRHFLRASGAEIQERVPEPAHAFIREHRRIALREPFLVGLGAIGPGHEWAIPKMFEAVICGLARVFAADEIRYFTLHVAQDEDHGAWLEEALARACTTEEGRREVRRGALLSLEARARFWSGVQRAVVRWRQPRAARPDGARPRSLRREIALTAWDGWRAGRRAEAAWRALAERRRPTMAELFAELRR